MSKAYSTFLDYVMPYAQGVTKQIAEHEIRNTCIEFCEKTLIIQRDHDPVTVVSGIVDYDLEPPLANHLIVKIMKMWFKDQEMEAVMPDNVTDPTLYNKNYDGAIVNKSVPTVYFQKDERTFTISPASLNTERSGITMRVALKPTRSSTTVEDVLLEDYADIIGAGALARLQYQTGKPYSDAKSATINQVKFEKGMNVARQRANRGYVRSDLRVRIPGI